MGTVFEAIQESLGRRVALKILPGNFALDPKRVERFHREARSTAKIHHANIERHLATVSVRNAG